MCRCRTYYLIWKAKKQRVFCFPTRAGRLGGCKSKLLLFCEVAQVFSFLFSAREDVLVYVRFQMMVSTGMVVRLRSRGSLPVTSIFGDLQSVGAFSYLQGKSLKGVVLTTLKNNSNMETFLIASLFLG